MFWSQLLLWLSGLTVVFSSILGVMFGVILASTDEYDGAAGIVFIAVGIMLTLIGAGLWFYASWRLYQSNKK